ncbi:GFA family protein [Paralimibaculum aggregatum]|uniref:GFA family protein n=1 Tax=Paralimibaculum aggregatum TaxID=3036245 RepID=A0ABQ6LP23_9RHOB|nr:GFA family protein [Limibaculum sp. NKW23]GMG84903.1 GFA family protein [Limibaculum sp. NKW23]
MAGLRGRCLCGAVRFEGRGAPGGVTPCHCGQCRRWSGGGPFMPVHFAGGVALAEGAALAWYRSSETGERGFCSHCGSSLFWRRPGDPGDWAVSAAALPEGTAHRIARHVWVDDRPGWYDFTDDAPRLTAAECLREDGT